MKRKIKFSVPNRSIGSELPYPSVSNPSLKGSVGLMSYSSSKPNSARGSRISKVTTPISF